MILGDYKKEYDKHIRVTALSSQASDIFGWLGYVLKIGDFEYTVIGTEPHQVLLDRPLEQAVSHGTPITWIRNA